jgi:hypothetical protein
MTPQGLIGGPTSEHEHEHEHEHELGEQIRSQQATSVRLRRITAHPPVSLPGDQANDRRVKTLQGASHAVGSR